MKHILILSLLVLLAKGCTPEQFSEPVESVCVSNDPINSGYSGSEALQNLMNKYTRLGLPGVAMAVYSPQEGFWAGSSGFAKIEDKTPMQICQLQYLQSVSKTYMAVAVLQLYEAGKIDLDQSISSYLPLPYKGYPTDGEKITVRMLLNHTSGVTEYTEDPSYVTYLLQHPRHTFSKEELLGFIKGKPLQYEPGAKYQYTNTNYMLLALAVDAITDDHAAYIRQNILAPLHLDNTLYYNTPNYLQAPRLVNTYWDRFGTGTLENNSAMQKANVSSMIGDDGMVATPLDVVKFNKALMEGKLLKPSSLALMKTWVNDKNGKPTYGMGMFHIELGRHVAYGHGGAGLGAGCAMLYFPEHDLYLFLATNVGTVTESQFVGLTENLKDEVIEALLH
ncbi:serine hydrolase domain-containing protein [Telluribacter humicola]|uniref:serine hydrolase domain-containing protein n=1 Tax=Telluribacter humicola TaxID=1720261 RepID=UPI001E4BFA1E|nr:serine hydrolase domain-containing protein [Telluribacter humicola]